MTDATSLNPAQVAAPRSANLPEVAGPAEPAVRQRLEALVVKSEVGLGGLASTERDLVFVWLWAVLPLRAGSEAEVNQALKATLASAAVWLDVDHVELRRWLVDSGCLRRDGFGRAYVRARPAELPGRLAAWVAPLAELFAAEGHPADLDAGAASAAAADPARTLAWATAWVQARREALAAERARKRERWLAARAGGEAQVGEVAQPGVAGPEAERGH
jgi:hypothetical protein